MVILFFFLLILPYELLSVSTFENPLKNYNFSKGLESWYTETSSQLEIIEVLPYHDLGKSKWINLGLTYPLEGVRFPTDKEVLEAEKILGVKEKI